MTDKVFSRLKSEYLTDFEEVISLSLPHEHTTYSL